MTPYWADQRGAGNYWEHKVVNVAISVGEVHTWKIQHVSGNDWGVYIDGTPARASNDAYISVGQASNETHSFDLGLESNCSTAHIASADNPCDINVIKKSSDHGGTWSNGPGLAKYEAEPGGGDYHVTGGWYTVGQYFKNRRNTN